MADAPTHENLRPTPGAWAVTREDTPRVFLAEDEHVISRLLALKLVAAAQPDVFSPQELEDVREHLLNERWADAVLLWMNATDVMVDVYPGYVPVWSERELDREMASMAIRMSRLFNEPT